MAKKVVQSESKQKPVKKKKHGCRNCLLTLLVFVVVLCAGAYFTGNYFTKKYLDMSLWDCFGVIHDVTHSNGKKIVSNKYADSDYNKFGKELKNVLFLKDDADFGAETLVSALTGDKGGKEAEPLNGDYLSRSVEILNASASGVVDKLGSVYVRENIDMERLAAYDESKHSTDYVLKISDKMLAAALDKSLDTLSGAVSSIGSMLGQYHIGNLSDVAKVEQVIFGTCKDTDGKDVPMVKFTVSIDARKIAKTMVTETTGQNLGFLVNMFLPKRMYVTAVIPAESGVELENNLYLNNMNDKKMNRAYKLVAGVTSLTGSKVDAKAKVSSAVNKSAGKAMDKVNAYFPLNKAHGGEVSLDLFEALIDVAKLNKDKPESEQLHAPDIINTLAGIVASEADDAIVEEYDYMHKWREDNSDKVVYIKTAGPDDSVPGYTRVDYEKAFMHELADKYMLDLREGEEDEITFSQLMGLFGLGDKPSGEKELELLDLFSPDKLKEVPHGGAAKVNIDSRMLGAVLQAQIDNLVTDGGSLGKFNPRIEYVITYKSAMSEGEHVSHIMLRAAIAIDTSSLLPDGNAVAGLVTGLMGDKAVVTFDIDVTPQPKAAKPTEPEESEEGEEPEDGEPEELSETETPAPFVYAPGKISYNALSVDKTNTILRTISCFVSDFNRDALLAQIETPIRDAIGKMNDVLEVEFVTSRLGAQTSEMPKFEDDGSEDEIELPTVFETVKQMLFSDDDENKGELNKQITPDGIEDVMRNIDEGDEDGFEESYVGTHGISTITDEEGNEVPTYSGSFAEILEKYYIVNGKKDDGVTDKYSKFDDLFGTGGVANKDTEFDSANFDFEKLYYDNRPIAAVADEDDLRPVFTENDLAALIIEKMSKDTSKIYEHLKDVRGLHVYKDEAGADTMELFVRVFAEKLVDQANASQVKLLPAKWVYLKATVHLGADKVLYYDKATGTKYASKEEADQAAAENSEVTVTAYYDTDITINNMGDSTYGTAMLMVESLNSGKSANSTDPSKALNLDTTACDLGAAIYGRFSEIEKSLGSSLEFIEGGIRLSSVYDFIKRTLIPNSDATAQDIREALQGLRAQRSEGTNSVYNYSISDFTDNLMFAESASAAERNAKVQSSDVTAGASGITASDRVFGRGLKNGFAIGGVYERDGVLADVAGTFEFTRMNILYGGLFGKHDFITSYFTEPNAHFDNMSNKAYLEFTFDTYLSQVTGSNKLGSALPEKVYVTVLFVKETGGSYSRVYFRINGLSARAQNALFDLANVNATEGSTLGDRLSQCDRALNGGDYGAATFGRYNPDGSVDGQHGYGYISFGSGTSAT